MIPLHFLAGKQVAVFGLGKAGRATIDALGASNVRVFAWDDNEASRNAIPTHLTNVYMARPEDMPWDELELLVLSPGIPLTHPTPHPIVKLAHKAQCPIMCDIELLYLACPNARYVAITGTNGKSTTTALTGHILKEAGLKVQVGGNIGTPALALEPLETDGVYVLELSSYQLDLLHPFQARVAVLLNITPDHLDRHGGMDGYVAAKAKIFYRQTTGDSAIIGIDDPNTRRIQDMLLRRERGPNVIRLSVEHTVDNGMYALHGVLYSTLVGSSASSLDLNPIPSLPGKHNWQNAAAAASAALQLGVSWERIGKAMRSFPGLAHRMELVADIDGVRFVNDSKATNVDAASKALACYEDIYWIAGGQAKQGDDIMELAPLFDRIKGAYLIGDAEEAYADALQGRLSVIRCGTLEVAVEKAAADAFVSRKKAVVLLSPACASFDQWRNFEDRGDGFKAYVRRLKTGKRNAS